MHRITFCLGEERKIAGEDFWLPPPLLTTPRPPQNPNPVSVRVRGTEKEFSLVGKKVCFGCRISSFSTLWGRGWGKRK